MVPRIVLAWLGADASMSKDMIAGKEWRVFKHCPSNDVAKAVLRAAKAKFPDREFKIVLIKWECKEVKS